MQTKVAPGIIFFRSENTINQGYEQVSLLFTQNCI